MFLLNALTFYSPISLLKYRNAVTLPQIDLDNWVKLDMFITCWTLKLIKSITNTHFWPSGFTDSHLQTFGKQYLYCSGCLLCPPCCGCGQACAPHRWPHLNCQHFCGLNGQRQWLLTHLLMQLDIEGYGGEKMRNKETEQCPYHTEYSFPTCGADCDFLLGGCSVKSVLELRHSTKHIT